MDSREHKSTIKDAGGVSIKEGRGISIKEADMTTKVIATKVIAVRPPKLWWSLMFKRAQDSYPRNKNETKEHWEKDIARIVGGIWKKASQQTRDKILLAYAKDENPVVSSNPTNPVGLKCPLCGESNPVAKPNIFLKCKSCGRQLISVKVVRKK